MTRSKNPLLLTVREVSLILRINRPKVYDLIQEGIINGFKLGSDWRVRRESVEKLVGTIPEEFLNSLNGQPSAAAQKPEVKSKKIAA